MMRLVSTGTGTEGRNYHLSAVGNSTGTQSICVAPSQVSTDHFLVVAQ